MRRHARLLIPVAMVALYLAAVNDQWPPKSDSALYVGLGRSLARGEGMRFNGLDQWGIPPAVPVLLAGCRLLVGEHYWLPNLVMTAAGLGVIALAWATARQVATALPRPWRDPLAFGTVVIVSTSGRLFIDSTCLMTDVPCTLLLTTGVYALLRWRDRPWVAYPVMAAAMLLATLTRIPAGVFAVGLGAAAVLEAWRRPDRWRRLAILGGLVVAAAALFGAWAAVVRARADPAAIDYLSPEHASLFSLTDPGRWAVRGQALLRLPEALTSSVVYQKLSWFGLVPLALILVGWWGLARRRQWVLVGPAVAYLLFLVVLGTVGSRYLLAIVPLTVPTMLVGLLEVTTPLRRRLARTAHRLRRRARAGARPGTVRRLVRAGRWIAIVAVPVTAAVCAAVSLPKVGREIYWMRHPDFYRVFDGGRWQHYEALADHLRRTADPDTDRCLGPNGNVIHYWSGVVCRSDLHLEGQWYLHLHGLPAETLARFAAESDYTRLVVPMDEGTWSDRVLPALAATGAFDPQVTRFGPMALVRRRAE